MDTKPTIITGLVIDPFARRIEHLQLEQGNLDDIYAALSTEKCHVSSIDVVRIKNQHGKEESLFIDEAGLFVPVEEQAYFFWNGQLVAGKGLIVGVDPVNGRRWPFEDISTALSPTHIPLLETLGWPDREAAEAYALRFQ
ncbi:MAG: hypothetical protein WA435_01620 [Gallionellaceae bacterium]